MVRLWAKIWKKSRMLKDMTVENGSTELNRTRKIFSAIEDVCKEFDLSIPIWLDSNIAEFQRHDKVRFNKDNFMEEIDFDYLEIQVIEEDE
jgi:hypothetical protein